MSLFGSWAHGPGAPGCATCFTPADSLGPGNRFRFCSVGHVLCRGCAVDGVRSQQRQGAGLDCPVAAPNAPRCIILLDTVAALASASSHAAAPSLSLSGAEVAIFRSACAVDAHAHPGDWVVVPCPSCGAALSSPSALRARGGQVQCHSCTHRVCLRCNRRWGAALVAGYPADSHEGRSCVEVEGFVAAAAAQLAAASKLSPAQEAALNIKHCPKCNALTSRIDGCDSMVCGRDYHGVARNNKGCGETWCWHCGGIKGERRQVVHIASCPHATH